MTPNGFGFLVVTVQRRGQEETVTAKDAAIELSAGADMSWASHVNALGLPTAAVGSNKATLPFFFYNHVAIKKKQPPHPRVRGGQTQRPARQKKFFNNSPPIMNTSEVGG